VEVGVLAAGLAEPCEASGGGVEGDEGVAEVEELGFVEAAEERGCGFGDAWEFPVHEVEGELAGAFETAFFEAFFTALFEAFFEAFFTAYFEAFDTALDTTGVDERVDEFRHGGEGGFVLGDGSDFGGDLQGQGIFEGEVVADEFGGGFEFVVGEFLAEGFGEGFDDGGDLLGGGEGSEGGEGERGDVAAAEERFRVESLELDDRAFDAESGDLAEDPVELRRAEVLWDGTREEEHGEDGEVVADAVAEGVFAGPFDHGGVGGALAFDVDEEGDVLVVLAGLDEDVAAAARGAAGAGVFLVDVIEVVEVCEVGEGGEESAAEVAEEARLQQ
jgi:hypothetical protein